MRKSRVGAETKNPTLRRRDTMPVEIPKDKWTGKIKEVTLGATAGEGGTRSRTVVVGGETTMPFMQFEAPTPHPPVIAIEIKDRKP
jgi:acetyl-CoA decarbonylase/synthase complex subunit delta